MPVSVWRIATDTREYVADDMSGKGAEKTGGRWNRQGFPVVYCAASIALACLETVVHFNTSDLPLNRFLVRIDVPDSIWALRQVMTPKELPVGWTAIPEGKVSLDIGQRWLLAKNALLMVVPSVIVPEESNVLINPLHPDIKKLHSRKLRPWLYDARLVAG